MRRVKIKITNKGKIPKALADAVKQTQSEYDNQGSNLSASALNKPVRIYWLEKRYWDELEVDVQDLIWSFVGTASHFAAEKAGLKDKNTIAEERYFKEVLGWKFSAQIDNYEIKTKTLSDFKITSCWSLTGEPKEDWIVQMNAQRLLMEEAGHEVGKIQICAIGRDWSKNKAKQSKDYPNKQVKLIKIPKWTLEETESYLEDKVRLLQSHEHTPDDELPMCSESDRWKKPTVFAVYKDDKAKRATKLFDNPIEAEILAKQIGGRVDVREGEDTRCIDYCQVCSYCNYWKEKYGK